MTCAISQGLKSLAVFENGASYQYTDFLSFQSNCSGSYISYYTFNLKIESVLILILLFVLIYRNC
jgi:hypothetical protein